MIFDSDKQTIRDLEIFPNKKDDRSIYSIYNRASTIGGQQALWDLFTSPVSDLKLLLNRKKEINFFFENNCTLDLNSRQIDFIEYYLNSRRFPLRNNIIDATVNGLSNKLLPDGDYYIISEGIFYIIQLIIDFKLFIKEAAAHQIPDTLKEDFDRFNKLIEFKTLQKVLSEPPSKTKDLSYSQINNLDHFFRVSDKEPFRQWLNAIYKIDVLMALSNMIKNDGYTLPEYDSGSRPVFDVTDSFHPALDNPIPNSFSFEHDSGLCFITGPNMSGKSTFLKTMGLLIYLSHLGLPVPAKKLRISIFNGIFTTINLADNLNLGYSHFYSEVKRVKDIALKINSHKNIVVIFDELFRGTNVKDAFDASLMIISALSKIRDNFFFISTHILEVAEELGNNNSITYRCFESELIDNQPVYDFKIKPGISKERIGMLIIKNEHIPDILNEIVDQQKRQSL
jgi:DNA mismatch repair protein MutS